MMTILLEKRLVRNGLAMLHCGNIRGNVFGPGILKSLILPKWQRARPHRPKSLLHNELRH
jgi:hypothetical protein